MESIVIPDDSLRAVIDTVLGRPEYQWQDLPNRGSWLGRAWRALLEWLFALQAGNPGLFNLVLWGLITVLVAILVHSGYIMYQTVKGASAPASGGAPAARVTIRDERWYRQQAERLAAAGHYAEAMQAAFQALVHRLESRGVVRFHPAKTPWEYAREARMGPEPAARLRGVVTRLYACAYAGAACGPDQYREWLGLLEGAWHASPD